MKVVVTVLEVILGIALVIALGGLFVHGRLDPVDDVVRMGEALKALLKTV